MIRAHTKADAIEYAAILERSDKGHEVDAMDLINALTWRCANQRRELAWCNTRIRDLESHVESLQDRWASRPLSSEDQAVRIAALEASVADAVDVLKIFSQDAAMLGYVDAAGWEQFDRLMQRLRKVETSASSDGAEGG